MIGRITAFLTISVTALWVAHLWSVYLYPLGNDPAIFQYHAWSLTVGEVPYLDAIDVNTPGIILLHWIWGSIFDFSDAIFLTLTMLLSTAAFAGAVISLRSHCSPASLVLAMAIGLWAFVGITPWDRGQRELLQGTFLLAAFFAASREQNVIAGALAGAALTLKITAAAILAPVAVLWLWNRRELIRPVILGFSIPVISVLAWLAAIGAWDSFWWTQIYYLPHHSSTFTVPWTEALMHPLVGVSAVVGGLGFANGGIARIMSPIPLVGIALYLFQSHGWIYHLHIAVPFLLPIAALVGTRRSTDRVLLILSCLPIVISAVNIRYDLTDGLIRAHSVDEHWDYDAHKAVAAYLNTNGNPDDRVLTNNDEHQLLYMAKRRGATRCLYSFLCSEEREGRIFQELANQRVATLTKRPAQWVVWNKTPYAAELDSLDANPKLAAWISKQCTYKTSIGPYGLWRCSVTR